MNKSLSSIACCKRSPGLPSSEGSGGGGFDLLFLALGDFSLSGLAFGDAGFFALGDLDCGFGDFARGDFGDEDLGGELFVLLLLDGFFSVCVLVGAALNGVVV
jgi:hypothetical protein